MSHWKKQLEVLSRASRRWADEARPPADDRASWEAFQERLGAKGPTTQRRGGRPAPWRGMMLASAVLIFGLGVGLWWSRGASFWRHPASPLFVVNDSAADDKPGQTATLRRLRFSDGSSVGFLAASRGEVLATDELGAHLRLAEGRAHFDVVHRASTSWLVDAGPFSVLVHGTVFDVRWAPTTGAFDVALFEGVVSVRGPLPGGEVTLRAGQHLTAVFHEGARQVTSFEVGDLRAGAASEASSEEVAPPQPLAPDVDVDVDVDADLALRPGPPVPPSVANGTPAPVAGAAMVPSSSPVARGTTRRGPSHRATPEGSGQRSPLGRDWGERVALGDFSTVLREAENDGFDRCLSTLPVASLGALVDAARYGRKTDLALRALQAERTRFPGSPPAHDAAFLMGRLTEDNLARPAEAIAWYERYLAESGNGRYAGDALGRLMLARERLGEKAAARQAARTYLARHADGAYVESARRLARE